MPRTAFRDPASPPAEGEAIGDDSADYSLLDDPFGQAVPSAGPVTPSDAVDGGSFVLSNMASLIGTSSAIGSGGATAAQVRQAMGESATGGGAGIKIGVLSDSFNNLGGAAADEASGALPSAANIQVLSDLSGGGSDEGRAMMQIIHDIASNASLAFYTAFNSEQDFANGILALAAVGCKVICDDVFYFDEPMFQNGVVAQAIETVEKQGVTFVTAAGNNGSVAYQSAWTPVSGSFDGISLINTQSFNGSVVATVTVGANSSYNVPLILEWAQPYGAETTSLKILVFQNGALVGSATNADLGEPSNPFTGVELQAGATYQIAVEDVSGPSPGTIKLVPVGNGIPVAITVADTGTIFGHAMVPGAITAGAVSTANTTPFGGTPQPESFSSWGNGTELLFNDSGVAYAAAIPLSPVDAAAVDDIATTVSGGLSDFYGTSAASASMAAAAAMVLAADPNLTPYEVQMLLTESTVYAGNSNVVGTGLVQIDKAVSLATAYAATGQHVSAVYAGQTARNVTIGSGTTLLVSAYASALQTTVQFGGVQQVVSGMASGTSVSSGGAESVAAGGVTSGTVLFGGHELVGSGGTAKGVVILNGGAEIVGSGGIASGTVVSSGASLQLQAGGSVTNTQLASGATFVVSSGAVVSGMSISSGVRMAISTGGMARGTVVGSGGTEMVSSGGAASGSIISTG